MRPTGTLLGVLAPVLLAWPAGPADSWPLPRSADVTAVGHDDGHGHGMSQDRAEGAARQGLSWRKIVGCYYPGTEVGRASGSLRVLLSADTTDDLVPYLVARRDPYDGWSGNPVHEWSVMLPTRRSRPGGPPVATCAGSPSTRETSNGEWDGR